MNKTITLIIAFVVIAGGSFYGGMKYSQNTTLAGNRTSFSSGRFQQFGTTTGTGGGTRGTRGGGFTVGEVIAKDDKSITVKLQNGGSQIVFFSETTPVMKSSTGSAIDITIGSQVMVAGSANQDGSVNAQSIQIRPTAQRPQ